MDLKFTKMHGCGNDYIYFNCFEQSIENPEQLAVALSDRHFGIGGDGIVLICPSEVADAKMRMFNADGSEGKMCGNAIRCVGKYLYDNKLVQKLELKIETLSGIKHLKLFAENGLVYKVTVDMGRAELDAEKIPVTLQVLRWSMNRSQSAVKTTALPASPWATLTALSSAVIRKVWIWKRSASV